MFGVGWSVSFDYADGQVLQGGEEADGAATLLRGGTGKRFIHFGLLAVMQ